MSRKRRWTLDRVSSEALFTIGFDLFKDGLSMWLTVAGYGYWLDTYLEPSKTPPLAEYTPQRARDGLAFIEYPECEACGETVRPGKDGKLIHECPAKGKPSK